jgi:hypothetical protein
MLTFVSPFACNSFMGICGGIMYKTVIPIRSALGFHNNQYTKKALSKPNSL